MIQVKENLYAGDDIFIKADNRPYNSGGFRLPGDLIDGEYYTFSAKVNQSDNGSGRCGFLVRKIGYPNSYSAILPIENFVYKFKYNKERQSEILVYPDVPEKTHNIGAEFYNISIVKGDGMDIYVPHKVNVKPENQALLPPEGNYKEIQAL